MGDFYKDELYLGTKFLNNNGNEISFKDKDIRSYIIENLTELFPLGFTIVKGIGSYKYQEYEEQVDKIINEDCYVVTLITESLDKITTDIKINNFIKDFKQVFNQESVIRLSQKIDCSFI